MWVLQTKKFSHENFVYDISDDSDPNTLEDQISSESILMLEIADIDNNSVFDPYRWEE